MTVDATLRSRPRLDHYVQAAPARSKGDLLQEPDVSGAPTILPRGRHFSAMTRPPGTRSVQGGSAARNRHRHAAPVDESSTARGSLVGRAMIFRGRRGRPRRSCRRQARARRRRTCRTRRRLAELHTLQAQGAASDRSRCRPPLVLDAETSSASRRSTAPRSSAASNVAGEQGLGEGRVSPPVYRARPR